MEGRYVSQLSMIYPGFIVSSRRDLQLCPRLLHSEFCPMSMTNLCPSCLNPGRSLISRKSWLGRGLSMLFRLLVLMDAVVESVKSEGGESSSMRRSRYWAILSMRGRSCGASEIHLQAISITIASSRCGTVSLKLFSTISNSSQFSCKLRTCT